jgi:hypothetical protein
MNADSSYVTPNEIYFGGAATLTAEMIATDMNINSQNVNANTVNIANETGTTLLQVNKPITIGYTVSPTVGTQIGYVYSMPLPAIQNYPVGTAVVQIITRSYTLPITLNQGIWMTTATAGIQTNATSGQINQHSVFIQYAGGLIGNQRNDIIYTPGINTHTNMQNTSGIITSTGVGALTLNQEISYIGVGASFSTRTNSNWLFRVVRIA